MDAKRRREILARFAILAVFGGSLSMLSTGCKASGNSGYSAESLYFTVVAGVTPFTAKFDPGTSTFSAGPDLTGSAGAGAHYFRINDDDLASKIIIIHGNGTASTTIYDPSSGLTSAGPLVTGMVGAGASAFKVSSGAWRNRFIVVHGGAQDTTSVYDPATENFSAGPRLTGPVGDGGHFARIPERSTRLATRLSPGQQVNQKGPDSRPLIVHGYQQQSTSEFLPMCLCFTSGPELTFRAWNGAASFNYNSSQGEELIVLHGDNIAKVTGVYPSYIYAYDPTVASSAYDFFLRRFVPGPQVPNNLRYFTRVIGLGGDRFLISSSGYAFNTQVFDASTQQINNFFDGNTGLQQADGRAGFLVGAGKYAGRTIVPDVLDYRTRVFDSSTNLASYGPDFSASVSGVTFVILLTTGPKAGKYLFSRAYKNSLDNSQLQLADRTNFYDPATNSFEEGPVLPTGTQCSIATIQVGSGILAGKIILFCGYNSTKVLDPMNMTIADGPSISSFVGAPLTFDVTSGIHAGKTMVIHGSPTKQTSIYDPAANIFTAGPSHTGSCGTRGQLISVSSGVLAGKALILLGCNTNETSVYDPATHTFSIGPTLPAATQSPIPAVTMTSGVHVGKTLVFSGYTSKSAVFYDPIGNAFIAGPGLPTTMSNTLAESVVSISSGPQAGKYLFLHDSRTTVYDPATNTFAAGPGTSYPGWGSMISMSTGANAGKALILIGSGTSMTDLYDPTDHSIRYNKTIAGAKKFPGGGFSIP